ncbi:MAG: tRNA pseudouridine(38-40) synthase TruA, partial [Christensenellales bacterium]
TGNAFLYNMVRILAGTLLWVGRGRIDALDLPEIIASKDRSRCGKTLPSNGLTLESVEY